MAHSPTERDAGIFYRKELMMLVLERRDDETIIIRTVDGFEVKVMMVRGMNGKGRIGVEAPKDWTINRGEIQQRIDAAAERIQESNDGLDELGRR